MNTQVSDAAIAEKALAAFSDPAFEGQPGYCQRFVRQVVESLYPDASFDAYFAPSAVQSMMNFEPTRFNVWEEVGESGQFPDDGFIQAGDILYKGTATSGPFGHVGIAFHNTIDGEAILCVAENSSYHMNPDHMGDVSGAKGWRTAAAFGPIEMVVRLTETQAQADAS